LVVVAHERRGFISRVLYPSIAERLVPLIPCPLLVIRAGVEASSFNAATNPERAIVAVTNNRVRPEINRVLEEVGLPSSQSASFVYVKKNHSKSARFYSWGRIARKIADCMKQYIVKDLAVEKRTTASELLGVAKDIQADVIVVEAVAGNASDGFSPSVLAKALLRESDLPVLIYPRSNQPASVAAEIAQEADHAR
jgi:nucleotide-binding universal stress UspA family protein